MSNKPKESLDRRDFMIASIATVGASAALAANAGSANAQDSATSSVRPAPGAPATVYTGDVIQGKKVVSVLDVNDLEPGEKHLLYFQGAQMPTGQHWHVSVTVAKGAKPGKRAVLVSGVHGDEMSSVHTVQTVMNQLNPAEMSGTVMAVTDVARPAMEGMQRSRWWNFFQSARSSTIMCIPVSFITRLSTWASPPLRRRSALLASWTSR